MASATEPTTAPMYNHKTVRTVIEFAVKATWREATAERMPAGRRHPIVANAMQTLPQWATADDAAEGESCTHGVRLNAPCPQCPDPKATTP